MRKLKNKIALVFSLFITISLSGQSFRNDFDLIRQSLPDSEKSIHIHSHTPVPFAFPGTHNSVKLVLGSTMWLYQNLISPQLSASCLFEPSCSGYSVNLLREYGVLRGMVFTADRLTRCNRMAARDFSYTRINPATGHIRENTNYYRLKKND